MSMAMAVVGVMALMASVHYGTQFYPPGEGYAEEKRNGRISVGLLLLAFALFVAAAATWHTN